MQKTEFHIHGMDCPSEEQIIRMKLEGRASIHQLTFDLDKRRLWVVHELDDQEVLNLLTPLGYGAVLTSTYKIDPTKEGKSDTSLQRRALVYVLFINALFFGIELVMGLVSGSMGLVADSLDMLADAMVYGLSLFAIGRSISRKKQVAKMSGYFQFALAILGFTEVIRRFVGASTLPDHQIMISVSIFSLIANLLCLWILQGVRNKEVHIRASWIFTSNDVVANLGVIMAGLMVYWLASGIPDLLIGSIVFLVVARGAWRILQISK